MSQEQVEVVREHIEAFRQGDPPRALSHLDPHVVWDPGNARPGPPSRAQPGCIRCRYARRRPHRPAVDDLDSLWVIRTHRR